ncbi:MAG: DUF4105 domain-containing protein [Armatimonadetes bacterium]|nr:DUF4105 domain-containing protein [Akkermansiaceae bacterium]
MNQAPLKKFIISSRSTLASMAKYLFAAWVFGLILFNGPFPSQSPGNTLLAIAWFIALFFIAFRIREKRRKWLLTLALFLIPILPYLFIAPSHNRSWETPYTRTSHAGVSGNTIIIHNFRSFDYNADGLPIEDWSTRSYDLRRLVAMDFFMSYWGSEYIGHPIFSFDFGEQGHVAFTIEARMEKDEAYQLFAGLYRRYELSYIPCEEADAVRVRTNFRKNENVHLYRTIATPELARARILEFVATMNDIKKRPRFYNVITSNCTTAVRSQMSRRFPMDWRVIVNGKLDEMLYEKKILVTGGLDFPELKRRAYINPKVRDHPEKQDFSTRIRENIPGFQPAF